MRDSLSQFICEKCNSGLKGFTQFRKELVYKQQNILYESLAAAEASEPTDYIESASYDEAFDASSIKHEAEVDVKIKLEPEYMSPEYLYEYEHQVEETQQTEEVPVIKKKAYKKATCPICHASYYKGKWVNFEVTCNQVFVSCRSTEAAYRQSSPEKEKM